MIELVKKSMLAGAGLTLLTAEKLNALAEVMIQRGRMSEKEAREALNAILETSGKTFKTLEEKKAHILNEMYSFWLYGVLSDEVEERVEKMVAAILHQLHIPRQQEMEDLRERISRLEKERLDE